MTSPTLYNDKHLFDVMATGPKSTYVTKTTVQNMLL